MRGLARVMKSTQLMVHVAKTMVVEFVQGNGAIAAAMTVNVVVSPTIALWRIATQGHVKALQHGLVHWQTMLKFHG